VFKSCIAIEFRSSDRVFAGVTLVVLCLSVQKTCSSAGSQQEKAIHVLLLANHDFSCAFAASGFAVQRSSSLSTNRFVHYRKSIARIFR